MTDAWLPTRPVTYYEPIGGHRTPASSHVHVDTDDGQHVDRVAVERLINQQAGPAPRLADKYTAARHLRHDDDLSIGDIARIVGGSPRNVQRWSSAGWPDRYPTTEPETTNPQPTEPTMTIDWHDLARCLGFDPELFFPVGTTGPAAVQREEAKNVCRGCLVREICLADAMRLEGGANAKGRFGIRGGLDENQRAALHKRTVKQRRMQEAAA